jgi:FKBP-type peptidyl-prolyl cis-trans isomerase FkpA
MASLCHDDCPMASAARFAYAAAMKMIMPIALVASLAACQESPRNYQAIANELSPPAPAPQQPASAPQGNSQTTATGLRVETLAPGGGPRAQMGDAVLVTYEGRLTDGTRFDASPEPVPMTVGELVPGFNEGLTLMNEGGRYRLHIPAALAYGAEGMGGVIPPNADLVFDVTLVDILPAGGAAR